MTSSLNTDDLTVIPQLDLTVPLAAALLVCLAVMIAAIVLAVVLSRPRRKPRVSAARGVHTATTGKSVWRNRINAIVEDHDNNVIDREEAFLRLAAVARDYASAVSGRDMSAQTLSDLHRGDRDARHRDGLNLLRQTIEALYPAEFADPQFNSVARQTDVRQAAEWVSTLVERWR
ncbi:hypothetical protein [Bifidobacterium pullorum]|uniref:hypothetical protein n=1 Tax=Bifidobacterium pullorum TaxID=78448 RepID=UPI003A927C5A